MTFVLTDKAMQSRKLPRERGSNRTHLENTSGQRFTIIQWRRVWQLFSFYQLASDARRGTGTARRNNHTNTRVTTAAHCTSTGIHDKTHQEPTTHRSQSATCWGCQWINKDNYDYNNKGYTTDQQHCTIPPVHNATWRYYAICRYLQHSKLDACKFLSVVYYMRSN